MDSWSTQPTPGRGWDDRTQTDDPAYRRLTPLTLGDVLDGMFRLLVSHWRVYLGTVGALLIPYYVVYGWVSVVDPASGFVGAFRDPMMTQAPPPTTTASPMSGALAALLGIASLFVTPMTFGLATRVAAEAIEGAAPTVGAVWRSTLAKFWALLGVVFLGLLAVIAAMIVPAILIGVAAAMDSPALAVVMGLVTFGAVVWVYTRLSLSFAVVIVERTGPVAGLRRSWQLTRGRFWRVFGTLLLTYFIVFIVLGLLVAASALIGAAFGATGAVILGAIAYLIGGIIITPLFTNVLTLLYYDGRIRREAYDLDVLTEEVTADPSAPPERPFG